MPVDLHISVLISHPSSQIYFSYWLSPWFRIDQRWASNLTSQAKLIYYEFSPVLSLSISFFFMIIWEGDNTGLSIHCAVQLIENRTNENFLSEMVKH